MLIVSQGYGCRVEGAFALRHVSLRKNTRGLRQRIQQ